MLQILKDLWEESGFWTRILIITLFLLTLLLVVTIGLILFYYICSGDVLGIIFYVVFPIMFVIVFIKAVNENL